jgi:tetratricopeptide (TPR) repeat protein
MIIWRDKMEGISTTELKYYGKVLAINFKKFLDRAVDKYNSLLTLDPEESKEVLLEISKGMEEKGNSKGAGEIYKKILSSEPNNVNALFKLAKAYNDTGQFKEAVEALKKVVVLDDSIAQAFYLLGSALQKAVELNPGYAEAYYKIGLIFDARSDHDRAIEAYQRTISFSPDFVRAYQSLGFAYESKGMRDEAVKYFKKAIDIEERRSGK